MRTVGTFEEVRAIAGRSAALVATMGYLHDGHLALVEAARAEPVDSIVMSVFVNPLQFDRPDDLERYPRDLACDATLAADAGVDVLFAPTMSEMYRDGPAVSVRVGEMGSVLEGEHRPGHFDGVATVVTKLLAGIAPSVALFGQKDAQQLSVVRRLVADLSFPTRIVGVPTVRDPDGLALSSRNVFIEDRDAALSLSRGLFAAADAFEGGTFDGNTLEDIVAVTVAAAGASVDYVQFADAATLAPGRPGEADGFLAVAARVGEVRLIDNVTIGSDGTVDRGRLLERPSRLTGGG